MSRKIEGKVFESGEVLFDTEKPLVTAWFILEERVDMVLSIGCKTIELQINKNNFIGDAAAAVHQKTDIEKLLYQSRAVTDGPVKAAAIPFDDIRK